MKFLSQIINGHGVDCIRSAKFCIKKAFLFVICLALLSDLLGCKKLVEVDAPVTSTTETNVYNNDATAISVMTGLYTQISQANFPDGGISSLSLFPALSADELTLFRGVPKPEYVSYYTNTVTSLNTNGTDYWMNIYPKLFVVNSVIEGLNKSDALSAAVKQQLLGEAKFMRAFFYFYLVNLYGDVPLVLNTDYTVNASLARTSKDVVWKQIISDLNEAKQLLNPNYLDITLLNVTNERVRPTRWAALALLARAYLYTKDWSSAEATATLVIAEVPHFGLSAMNEVFLSNSTEAIWQLQPVITGLNTQDARLFVIPESGPDSDHPVYLSESLVKAFEMGDDRKNKWIDSVTMNSSKYHYANKYRVANAGEPVTEYEMVLRLSEQYLIRAEARNEQGNVSGAIEDLNFLRAHRRAEPNDDVKNPLPDISVSLSKQQITGLILHERQVELFTEWGNRWFDLKRTGTVDVVMTDAALKKGGKWSSYKQYYPIPLTEIQSDSHLVQNDGY